MSTPSTADEWYELGLEHARESDHANALSAYSTALQLQAGHVKARLARAMLWQQLGKDDAAIDDFTQVIEEFPDWAGLWFAYYGRGRSRHACGELQSAIDDCTSAIEINAECLDARYVRAISMQAMESLPEAIEDLDFVLRQDPSYCEAYYARGSVHHAQARWELSFSDFTKFQALAPLDDHYLTQALHLRAVAAFELGNQDAALADLTRAIERNPEDASHYFRRSQVYAALGNNEAAGADLEKGNELRER